MFIAKLNKTARFAISCKIENLFKIMQPPPKKKKPKKLFDGVSTGLPLFYIAGYYRNSPGAAFSFGSLQYNILFQQLHRVWYVHSRHKFCGLDNMLFILHVIVYKL